MKYDNFDDMVYDKGFGEYSDEEPDTDTEIVEKEVLLIRHG